MTILKERFDFMKTTTTVTFFRCKKCNNILATVVTKGDKEIVYWTMQAERNKKFVKCKNCDSVNKI